MMTDEERRDLDETRRLLYAALAASHTERYELVGTIVNALRHHQGMLLDRSLSEALSTVVEVVEGGAAAGIEAQELIEDITARLDDPEVLLAASVELPPEITNALAALDELLGTVTELCRHRDLYHPRLTVTSVEYARAHLAVARAYVDRAGS